MRNVRFSEETWEPSGPNLKLRKGSVGGPFPFLNPTTALYDIKSNDQPGGRRADLADLTDEEKQSRAKVRWNARDYRKGRYVLVLPRNAPLASKLEDSSDGRSILRGIGRMFTLFPYWDVSWLIGVSFTIGCLIFVACGLFYWLPIVAPSSEFPGEEKYFGGLTSFIGATLFQVGAFLLFFESYNDRAETQFGGAVESFVVDSLKIARRSKNHRPKHFDADHVPDKYHPGDELLETSEEKKMDHDEHAPPTAEPPEPAPSHEHSGQGTSAPAAASRSASSNSATSNSTSSTSTSDANTLGNTTSAVDMEPQKTVTQDPSLPTYNHSTSHGNDADDEDGAVGQTQVFTERKWKWWPSWHDVRTHYIYEIGFLASFTMSLGATIFYICGILSIPGLFQSLDEKTLKGAYYGPYLVGGVLFALSSLLYILENQPNWYTPQVFKIGWHIGFFNMIGGIGWTFAASLGYCSPSWCEYQSELTLVWASAAFAFGSALQWYESLDKYVVVIED